MTAFENNAERVPCWECRGEGGEAIGYDGRGGVRRLRCRRCQGNGTVLVDKPCSECGGKGRISDWFPGMPLFTSKLVECDQCNSTGVEPRDKRMERLMREAVEHYAGDYPPFTHGGACRIEGLPLHIGCTGRDPAGFTGWCVANWQMRKAGCLLVSAASLAFAVWMGLP